MKLVGWGREKSMNTEELERVQTTRIFFFFFFF